MAFTRIKGMSPIRSLTRALQTWVQNFSSRTGSVELRPIWLKPVMPASRLAVARFAGGVRNKKPDKLLVNQAPLQIIK
jgi:hypothetical protein